LDRKETEFRADEVAEQGPTVEAPPAADAGSRTEALFRQGEEHFAAGEYQQAIHVWTRILFVDRGNLRVREALDEAKKVIAERQRRLDLDCAEAQRLFDGGDVEGARKAARAVLATDASHVEANHLEEKIAALERRNEPARALPVGSPAESGPSKGIVIRVPRTERAPSNAVRPIVPHGKMIAFIAAALVVFAASALYLYQNWEGIVSDGQFRRPVAPEASPGAEGPLAPVPDLDELRYFDGERLFQQGRYREALAKLSRIARGSPVTAEARSLILRIEERLLRSPEAAGGTPGSGEEEGETPTAPAPSADEVSK
jgi:tetratricopeptide (TPR) repeat protein